MKKSKNSEKWSQYKRLRNIVTRKLREADDSNHARSDLPRLDCEFTCQNYATGVDEISPKILNMAADGISRSITSLFITIPYSQDAYHENGSRLQLTLCPKNEMPGMWRTTSRY